MYCRVKTFITKLVKDLPVSGEDKERTKIAVMKYSEKSDLIMHLNQFSTAYDVINHLEENLSNPGKSTKYQM